MNGFEMTTDVSNIPISGRQKAAMLLTELGSSVSSQLIPYLSDLELKKLRKAVGSLGSYSPKKSNFFKVQQREIRVLEDVCKFGIKKRFLNPEVLTKKDYGFMKSGSAYNRQNTIIKELVDNPENITNVLRTWLGEE